MIDRVLEQMPAIRRVLGDDRRSQHLIPTWQDLAVLESVNAALKKVAEFHDALSSETMVTASSVKPVLQLLMEELLPAREDTELTKNLKKAMKQVLEEKYSPAETQQLLGKTTFLDPRYRDGNHEEEIRDALLEEMLAMPLPEERRRGDGEAGDGDAANQPGPSDGDGARAPAPPPPQPKKKKLADLLGKRRERTSAPPAPKRVRADLELTRYLQEEALDEDADPLAWWRDNQARFPLLSKLARKYLTVCATSTASERVFSTAGNIVTHLRASLKPEKVNMLVFLARNKPEY